jgi:hypothetical protein
MEIHCFHLGAQQFENSNCFPDASRDPRIDRKDTEILRESDPFAFDGSFKSGKKVDFCFAAKRVKWIVTCKRSRRIGPFKSSVI